MRDTTTAAAPPHESPASTPAWRVEVHKRSHLSDPHSEEVLEALRELGLAVRAVRFARGFLLPPELPPAAAREIAHDLLADPVADEVQTLPPGGGAFEAAEGTRHIHVLLRPGVSDPAARTLEGLLVHTGWLPAGPGGRVATYRAYAVETDAPQADLARAAVRVLANPTVELVRFDGDPLPYGQPHPRGRRGRIEVPLLDLDDEGLRTLSREGCLALALHEMRAIQAHFRGLGREPTACELETLAQTWSEHCKHKTLTGPCEFTPPGGGPVERLENILAETIVHATRELQHPDCVSVFEDNAGIVRFDEGHDLCIKVETHNHPSALDPYGGAGTGIGGVIRDILGAGRGARPIGCLDAFFVGPQDLPADRLPGGTLHPKRILGGVVAGVRDYGNRMGIPTISGGVWYHEGYVSNPLVFCGTVGLIPHDRTAKEVRPGDWIVSVGGRTGLDGIHGATFSSIELSEDSDETSASAVQIGDPITEKRVLDALLVARDRDLYRAVTDCGAGGFSSAIGEMGESTGAEVDLAKVPLKYPGLASHEIWISEAQERMVLAVPPEHLAELLAVFEAEDVEASVLGRFTDTGRLVVRDGSDTVAELDMAFLHRGLPRRVRTARWTLPVQSDPGAPRCPDPQATLLALLAAPDIHSKEWIVRQYDHEVGGRSVVGPLGGLSGDGPNDAACLQPLDASRRGVVLACGASARYGALDPYAMALAAIDEALRNAVCVGGDPDHASLLDNFAWGDCEDPEGLGSLVLAARGCRDGALAYGTPFVSGKDSLNNTYRVGSETRSIPPTLLITCLAVVADVARTCTHDLKAAGNELWLVGRTRLELGGSHYLEQIGVEGGIVPRPDLAEAPRLLRAVARAIAGGLVESAHDLAEGGLGVALAEMAVGGRLGVEVELGRVPVEATEGGAVDGDALRLFSESCTRILLEVRPDQAPNLEALFRGAGLPLARIGAVVDTQRLLIHGSPGGPSIDLPVDTLRRAFGASAP